MVIGIVVNVMEDERRKLREAAIPEDAATLESLQEELRELKSLVKQLSLK